MSASAETLRHSRRVPAVRSASIFWIALGVLLALGFGFAADAVLVTHFQLSDASSSLKIGALAIPVRTGGLVCGVVMAGLGIFDTIADGRARLRRATTALAAAAAVTAFLCWAAQGKTINLAGLATATVTGALPLVLGALAGVLCERSGVINIAIEGQFLLGAFTASLVASVAGVWVGLLAGALAGGLVGGALGLLAIRYLADQIIVGVVLNLLAMGLTGFLFNQIIVPNQATLGAPPLFAVWRIPGLANLPVVGPALFDQNVILYLTIALLLAVHLMLGKTRWGLRTLAVGESPEAAESAGVNVYRIRYLNVLIGGLIAGVAGVYLTIGSVGAFGPNISSGKGFIALAAVIFGGWRPLGALLAGLLFGFADAIGSTLSIVGTPIPTQLLQMFPYLVTILAVAGLVGRVRAPAADGKPFVRA